MSEQERRLQQLLDPILICTTFILMKWLEGRVSEFGVGGKQRWGERLSSKIQKRHWRPTCELNYEGWASEPCLNAWGKEVRNQQESLDISVVSWGSPFSCPASSTFSTAMRWYQNTRVESLLGLYHESSQHIFICTLLYQPEALAQAKFLLESPPSFLQPPSGPRRGEFDSDCSHLPGPELFPPSGTHPHTHPGGATQLTHQGQVALESPPSSCPSPWALEIESLHFWHHYVLVWDLVRVVHFSHVTPAIY